MADDEEAQWRSQFGRAVPIEGRQQLDGIHTGAQSVPAGAELLITGEAHGAVLVEGLVLVTGLLNGAVRVRGDGLLIIAPGGRIAGRPTVRDNGRVVNFS